MNSEKTSEPIDRAVLQKMPATWQIVTNRSYISSNDLVEQMKRETTPRAVFVSSYLFRDYQRDREQDRIDLQIEVDECENDDCLRIDTSVY